MSSSAGRLPARLLLRPPQHVHRRLDDVAHHRQMREQVELLKHHADLRAHRGDGAVGVRPEDAALFVAIRQLAVDPDAPGFRHLQVIDAAEQGGFAAAGGADDAYDFAGGNRQIDSAQHMRFAEMLVQVFDPIMACSAVMAARVCGGIRPG